MRACDTTTVAGPKTLLLTLDLEEDGGGITQGYSYDCAAHVPELVGILRRYGASLTVFVCGRLLDERPDIVEAFGNGTAVFENHGYDHGGIEGLSNEQALDNLERGHESYRRFFGHEPRGYRAPLLMFGQPELDRLVQLGYRYDSSIVPAKFPGRFDWSGMPTGDFVWHGTSLLECPISVTRRLRIPTGVSYMQLIGWPIFRRLLCAGTWPQRLLVNFHLHDVFPGNWLSRTAYRHQVAYWRSQRGKPMTLVLERLLETCVAAGYESTSLTSYAASLLEAHRDGLSLPAARLPA